MADRAIGRGLPPLASLAALVEALTAAGGLLRSGLDATLGRVAVPACAVLLGVAAWLARAGASRGARIAVGAGLALAGQLAIRGDATWTGIAALAAAFALCLRAGPAPDTGPEPPLPRGLEVASYLAVAALFTVLCLHRMDVFPTLYFDEVAFVTAARMWLNDLPRGDIVTPPFPLLYGYERFAAQAVPLALQGVAVAALSPGVHAIRVASMLAGLAALALGAWTLRRFFGARLALVATPLCAFTALFLAYSRQGAYHSVSTLHGVGCVAALLWHAERRDTRSALVLGLLLGASLYLYQLSWFAPILAGAAWLAIPRLRAREGLRTLVPAGAATAVALVPAFTLVGSGIGDVAAQTFDARASWIERPRLEFSATLDAELDPARVRDLREELGPVIGVRTATAPPGTTVLRLNGPEEDLDRAQARLEAEGFRVSWSARSRAARAGPLSRLGTMLRQLFRDPGFESAGRRVTEPLLGAHLAGLIVPGLALAARQRAFAWRAVAVWVVLAALLPGTIGTPFPRRAVLVFPFAQALIALPLVELLALARAGIARRRRVLVPAGALLGLALAAAGSDAYFRHWYVLVDAAGVPLPADAREARRAARAQRDGFLELSRIVKQLPAREPVLVAPLYTGLAALFRQVDQQPDAEGTTRVLVRSRARTAADVRRASCAVPPPFTWIGADTPAHRELFTALEDGFRWREEPRPPYRLLRVTGRRAHACPTPER